MVLTTTIISFIVSLISTVLITFGYVPDAADDQLSEYIVYNLNGIGKSAYLIASLERYDYTLNDFVADPISWACTIYIMAVLVITTVIAMVCWTIIRYEIHKGSRSTNSMKSQQQLNMVLMVQVRQ